MGILDFPRLFFQGTAVADVPTGNNDNTGNIDIGTLDIYVDYKKISDEMTVQQFQELQRTNPGPDKDSRYNFNGDADEYGGMSRDAGFNHMGTNAFTWQAAVTGGEFGPNDPVLATDSVINKALQLLGDWNPLTRSTVNNARMVDADMASNWTPQIIASLFTLGADLKNVSTPITVGLTGKIGPTYQGARHLWFNNIYFPPTMKDENKPDYMGSAVFQFVIPKKEINWGPEYSTSDVLQKMNEKMASDPRAEGLVVRYAVYNMATVGAGGAALLSLTGTIGIWYKDELETITVERHLVPKVELYKQPDHNGLEVGVAVAKILHPRDPTHPTYLSVNLVTTVPYTGRDKAPPPGLPKKPNKLWEKVNLGNLGIYYREDDGQDVHVGDIPWADYNMAAYNSNAGNVIVTIDPKHAISMHDKDIILKGTFNDKEIVLLEEQAWVIQTDSANFYIDFEDVKRKKEYDYNLEWHVYHHGRHDDATFYLHQYYNTLGYPNWAYNHGTLNKNYQYPTNEQFHVMVFKNEKGEWVPNIEVKSKDGVALVKVKGKNSGAARIYASFDPNINAPPLNPPPGQDAAAWQYADFGTLGHQHGYWTYASACSGRVLPNDWALYHDIKQHPAKLTYELVWFKILRYYELLFPFMAAHVFKFSEPAKVEIYGDLIVAMTNTKEKNKTYYMPPTREMSEAKFKVLRRYINSTKVPRPVISKRRPVFFAGTPYECTSITTREQLIYACKEASEMEHAILIQYLYAAWSLPSFKEAKKLGWPDHFVTAVSGNGTPGNGGWQGTIINICYQEMLHYLLASNVLQAVGGSPNVRVPPFPYSAKRYFGFDLMFSLQPFSKETIQRFIRFEWPDFFSASAHQPPQPDVQMDFGVEYYTIGELYTEIKNAIKKLGVIKVPGATNPPRGNWNLFLSKQFQAKYPNYDATVVDDQSAIFAIDIIIDQGEGVSPTNPDFLQSHYNLFTQMAKQLEHLSEEYSKAHPLEAPWNPAYPVINNPTLGLASTSHESANTITDKRTAKVLQLFDLSYATMLSMLINVMSNSNVVVDNRLGKLFNLAIDMMIGVMKPVGQLLMTLPSGHSGLTAGPSFEINDAVGYIPVLDVSNIYFQERVRDLTIMADNIIALYEDMPHVKQILATARGVFDSTYKSLTAGGVSGQQVPPMEKLAYKLDYKDTNASRVVRISLQDALAINTLDEQVLMIRNKNDPTKRVPAQVFVDPKFTKTVGMSEDLWDNLGLGEKSDPSVILEFVSQSSIPAASLIIVESTLPKPELEALLNLRAVVEGEKFSFGKPGSRTVIQNVNIPGAALVNITPATKIYTPADLTEHPALFVRAYSSTM